MNNLKSMSDREWFILKYKAAVKAKISKEQLADFLGMLPKSLLRRRLEIKELFGLDLPYLHSDTTPFEEVKAQYISVLDEMVDRIKNSSTTSNNFAQKVNKKYIITSAQNATPVHKKFFKSLKNFCDNNEAQLIVIPNRYKNPTSVWSINDRADDWWDVNVQKYLLCDEIKLCRHLRIMGNIKIQPTATSPLSGFDTVSDLDSAIFGHPRVEWKNVPTVLHKLPKILVTTGSVTIPNYTDSKAGHKGHLQHRIGALVVEIDDDEIFHIRHVEADEDGSFYDLDKLYTSEGVKGNQHILALYAGDSHAEEVDSSVKAALYTNPDSVAETLKPQYMLFGDVLSFNTRSHHDIRDELGRFKKHYFGVDDNVEKGLQKVADFLDEVSKPFAKNIIVRSNHDEHLEKWASLSDPKSDPENARFYYYLKYHQYVMAQNDTHFDCLEFWTKNPDQERGMSNNNTIFLSRKQPFELMGIEMSLHGDVGANGAKGSLIGFSKLGQKVIVGHSHTPGVIGNAYQVGTSSTLNASYCKGPSGWLQTSAIVYPNGKITLINIIEGKWRLSE